MKTEHENEKVILINKSNIMDNEKEILNDFDFNDNDKADKEITVSNPKDLIIEIKLSNESVIDVDKCNSSEKTSAENGMNHEKDEQKEIQLQLSLEDKKNGPLQVKQNKINILQNVKIPNAGGGTVSPFQNHLFFPSPIASSQKRQQKDPLPSAISAIEYRKILQQKIDLKEKAENEKLKRKQERIRKKEDREVIPKKKQKKMYAKKLKQCNRSESESDDNTKVNLTSNIPSSSKKKEHCASCDLTLDSDTEDNDLKNIGCDSCPNWYHLKCTEFQGCNFSDVENLSFICDFCTQSNKEITTKEPNQISK